MFTTDFATENMLLFSLVLLLGATGGFLASWVRYSRHQVKLDSLLKQTEQSLTQRTEQLAQVSTERDQLQLNNQQLALSEGKLEARLIAEQNARQSEEKQFSNALSEIKAENSSWREQVAAVTQQHHTAEKQRDTARAEVSALTRSNEEIRQRLHEMESQWREERQTNSQLKDELAQEGKKSRALEVTEKEVREQIKELKNQLADANEKHRKLQERIETLNHQYTQLKTEQDEREASHQREVKNFEHQKERLTEQFKVLSNEILDTKTKALQEQNKVSLTSVINPFQQTIDSFKKEVQDIHHRETTQQGELRRELESLKALNQKMTTEAHHLSTALRGQKKLQGNWGELVLENVLERSGLQLGKDYQREVSINTEAGRQRPDVVVYLPQSKHLIIDAKVSLNAYTRFVNAEDETSRMLALKDHVQAVGNRIKELADRDYYKLPGLNSPEMVFMFVPIESAFVEALKADEHLFQQAIENNVLVATPTTLLTSLNIVRQLWRYEDQNKHTAALAGKAEAVFKKLNTFLASFDSIKRSLEKATDAYTKAENQLVSGRGNLVKQVGDFKNLAPAIKGELPEYFKEKAALEIDYLPAETEQN